MVNSVIQKGLFSFKTEEEFDRIPLEFGISLNKSWMSKNNITDVNIFFKDPINSINFRISKVNVYFYLLQILCTKIRKQQK